MDGDLAIQTVSNLPAMINAHERSSVAGYHGAFLRIDLTDGNADAVALAPDELRRFLGGSGLGTFLLLAGGAAEADPLLPAAMIAFVFSPLVGSPLTTSAKFAVVSKSPLTDRLNDSLVSSAFAIAGKRSGYDAFILTGRAARPSVLLLDDGHVELQPAGDLWGMTCGEAEQTLRARLGGEFQVAVIGPAGERLVRFATISHNGRHAGRGGSGAVMGSKNLKAIAVRGTRRCRFARPQELVALAKTLSDKSFGPGTAKYRELGTASNLLLFNRLGALPTRNFQQATFDGASAIAPESLSAARQRTRAYCASCTIGCEHIYALGSDPAGVDSNAGVRVEYENLFSLGPLCGVDDPDTVLRASKLCDELGLDTISAGGTIAFAMECVQRGILDEPRLRFGDGAAVLEAVERIGRREALGDRLAEGSRRFAREIGRDAIRFAPQVKGLELPGYEPRALQTLALGLAVGTRGADHNRSGAYEVDFSERVDRRNVTAQAAPLAIETEDKAALMDSLILCKFLRGVFEDFYTEACEMLNLVTGWDMTANELRRTARRIVNAKKLFNIRAGWQPTDDTLPDRFFDDELSDGSAPRLSRERFRSLVAAYNRHRGWSPDGWITPEQVAELQLP